jgi:hypothetical protein
MTIGGEVEGELAAVREILLELMGAGGEPLAGEEDFARLALRIFRLQCRGNAVYGAFVRGRGIDPDGVDDWRSIPPVPTAAFREFPLVTGSPGPDALVFRTSGTTGGRERRGEHHVADPSIYHASLLPPFRQALLPDGARLPVAALLPPPSLVRDSSLGHMVQVVMDRLAAPGGGWFVDASGAIDEPAFLGLLEEATAAGTPLLLVGTAFAWVHWMDLMDARGIRLALPRGSRIMETGGFKGRSRSVPRDDLYAGLSERLGIPLAAIVNEYGMTELLSQFYEPVLSGEAPAEPGERYHVGPSWVRTRVLHPETLEEVPPGQAGLLCHVDLANVRSVMAVLTSDLGVRVGTGFRVLGRAPGAEPRGCSLVMEELLAPRERGG